MTRKLKIDASPPKKRRARRAMLKDTYLEDIHIYRLDRRNFTIYVGGERKDYTYAGGSLDEPGVEFNMADRFELNLGILSGISEKRPILVKLSSCGGNWEEGMQMFGAILTCPNPVTVLATKWARSMTSLIPLAADRFVIRPPAQYMYHRGSYGFSGTDQEADAEDIERRKSREMMFRIYVARLLEQGQFSGLNWKKIRTILEQGTRDRIDVWLSSHEAVRWGFADAVFEGNMKELRTKVVNIKRRKRLMAVITTPIGVTVKISRS